MIDVNYIIRQAYEAGRARGAVEAVEVAAKLPSVDAEIAFNDDMYGWLDENGLGESNVHGLARTETVEKAMHRLIKAFITEEEELLALMRPTINSLHAQYPEVMPFVDQMLAELWDNRGKGDQAGWRSMTLRQAWSEISWHVAKLAAAVRDEDAALMRELTADVANGAMMLFDIVNLHAPEKPRG